jgi:hypothetical protein
MARVTLTCALLLLCAIFSLPSVKAFSPPQLDRAVGSSSGVLRIAKNGCDSDFKQCMKKCRGSQMCKDNCVFELSWCRTWNS